MGKAAVPDLPLRLRPRLRKTVSNCPGFGMEIDVEGRGAGEWIGAHVSVRLQLAGGQVQLEFAQIDGAVALGIGTVHYAVGRGFAGEGLGRGAQVERSRHGDSLRVAFGPDGGGGAVEQGADSDALEGRLADHVEDGVERHVFELGGDFAVDGNCRGRGPEENGVAIGGGLRAGWC